MKDLHRGAYHRYFEGYTETTVITPSGKTRIERIYTGYLYKQDIPDSRLKKNKTWYTLAYLAYIIVLIWCGTRYPGPNEKWYVALPVMLSLFSVIWYTPSLFTYLFAKRQLIVRQYRAVEKLKNIAIVCGICFITEAISLIAYAIIMRAISFVAIVSIVLYIGVAVAFFRIFVTEKSIDFSRRVANVELADIDNSYEIAYKE